MYAGYTICTSREHIVYGAFCGSTMHHACPPVREIVHSLKLLDYLHVLSVKLLHDPKEFWVCTKFSLLSVSEKLYNSDTTWIF